MGIIKKHDIKLLDGPAIVGGEISDRQNILRSKAYRDKALRSLSIRHVAWRDLSLRSIAHFPKSSQFVDCFYSKEMVMRASSIKADANWIRLAWKDAGMVLLTQP